MPGPPEVVWALITDWEHQDDWMLEASDFEVIGDQREGVGVEAKATVRIAGIKTRDTVRVSMWEPPRILVIDHLGWVKEGDLVPATAARSDRQGGSAPRPSLDAPCLPAGSPCAPRVGADERGLGSHHKGAGRAR